MAKKSIKIKETKAKGGGIDLTIGCSFCNKPITKTTEFGMTCEDECAQKNWEKENGRKFNVEEEIDNFFGQYGGQLGSFINSFNQPGQEDIDMEALKNKFKNP